MFISQDSTVALTAVLTGSVTSVQPIVSVTYADTVPAYHLDAVVATNNVTPVTLLSAPSAGVTNLIKLIKIYNPDSQTNTVLIKLGTNTVGAIAVNAGQTIILSDNMTNPLFSIPFETNTSNIKIEGSASVGSLLTIPRADHVHPAQSYARNTFTYYATMSALQSSGLTVNSPVKFNQITSDSGTSAPSLTISGSTYQIALPTGFKYEFIGILGANYSSASGFLDVQMYNNTGSVYFGTNSGAVPVTAGTNQDTCSVFMGEITNSSGSAINVSVCIQTVSNLTNINPYTQGTVIKIIATKL